MEQTEHNYRTKLEELVRRGLRLPGGVYHLATYHDDDCSFWKGGRCDCDPELAILPAGVGTDD